MGIGELAALGAALCWAAASLLYGQTKLSAWGLNLVKNILAAGVLLLQLLFLADWQQGIVFRAGSATWQWLALSGVIGIVIGDTLYFRSLQVLGPRKALILSTTAPLFAAVFGALFLNEVLTPVMLTGVLMTTGGVTYVVADRKSAHESPGLFPGSTALGVSCAIGAAVCQAAGGVCSRIGMQGCGSVEGAWIRLTVSAVAVGLIVAWQGQLRDVWQKVKDRELLRRLVPAVLMGTWLGIWLCQVAYKETSVSVATTLLATTPLFVIPLLRVFQQQKITARAVIGTVVATLGVVFVVAGTAAETADGEDRPVSAADSERGG